MVPGLEGEDETPEVRSLDMFLQEVALITDADVQDEGDPDKVSLMTIHAAKGLEFPYVYVVGMEENLFPSIQSLNSRTDLEEERRLFYVAMTRAEQRLFLSFAENRYRWGNLTICEPSRFIDEVDKKYLDFPQRVKRQEFAKRNETPVRPSVTTPKNLKKVSSGNAAGHGVPGMDEAGINSIQPGMQVEHNRFGKGKVISIEGNGPNKKAAVFFKNVGQKQLLLKYARLRILE
jgi:DNA helicase-2/ATP-dependent DNA helicase PcrA